MNRKAKDVAVAGLANYERHQFVMDEVRMMRDDFMVDRVTIARLTQTETRRYMNEKSRLRMVVWRERQAHELNPRPDRRADMKFPQVSVAYYARKLVLKQALLRQVITLARYEEYMVAVREWALQARAQLRCGGKPVPIPRLSEHVLRMLNP